MGRVCVAILAACLLAAPASASRSVYDPEGATPAKQSRCMRRDGAFVADMVSWSEMVKTAVDAYMVEDFAKAKRWIGRAQSFYWEAGDPCSTRARSVDRKCQLATTYYAIGIDAAARNDADRAFRYMRAGHRAVQKATEAVGKLRRYYGQL